VSVPLDHSPTNAIGYFSSPKQLVESVSNMLDKKNSKGRIANGLAARRDVLTSDTYFHRVAKMFDLLGLKTEAERTMGLHANQGL
jgi:hypothetical protein